MFFGGLARFFGLTPRRKGAKVLILIDADAICLYCICCLPFIYVRALRFFDRASREKFNKIVNKIEQNFFGGLARSFALTPRRKGVDIN